VHKLVDELCKYPEWRRAARRRAARGLAATTGQLPAQMPGDSHNTRVGCREDPEAIATVPASDGYPYVAFGRGHRPVPALPMFLPRSAGRIAHAGWFCQTARFPDRSRPGLLRYRAEAGGVGCGLNKAHTTFPVSLGVV